MMMLAMILAAAVASAFYDPVLSIAFVAAYGVWWVADVVTFLFGWALCIGTVVFFGKLFLDHHPELSAKLTEFLTTHAPKRTPAVDKVFEQTQAVFFRFFPQEQVKAQLETAKKQAVQSLDRLYISSLYSIIEARFYPKTNDVKPVDVAPVSASQ